MPGRQFRGKASTEPNGTQGSVTVSEEALLRVAASLAILGGNSAYQTSPSQQSSAVLPRPNNVRFNGGGAHGVIGDRLRNRSSSSSSGGAEYPSNGNCSTFRPQPQHPNSNSAFVAYPPQPGFRQTAAPVHFASATAGHRPGWRNQRNWSERRPRDQRYVPRQAHTFSTGTWSNEQRITTAPRPTNIQGRAITGVGPSRQVCVQASQPSAVDSSVTSRQDSFPQGNSGAPNLPENATDQLQPFSKLITCEHCHRIYKWPHSLDCLHVFCFSCIVSQYDCSEKVVKCSKCERRTLSESDLSELRLDYQTCHVMAELNHSPFICTTCDSKEEAVIYCGSCKAFLCSGCQGAHNDHQLLGVTKTGVNKDGDRVPLCEIHVNQPLSKYCGVCKCMICLMCMPDHVHQNVPQGHGSSCLELEAVYGIVVNRLKRCTEEATIKMNEIAEYKRKIPNQLQEIENQRKNIKKQIDHYTEYCKSVIEQNRMGAYNILEQAIDEAEKGVGTWAKSCEEIHNQLEVVSNFICNTVSRCTNTEVLKLQTLMEKEYKRTMENHESIVKSNEGLKVSIDFDPLYTETESVLNNSYFSVTCAINGEEKTFSPITGLPSSQSIRDGNYSDPRNAPGDASSCQNWPAVPGSLPVSYCNRGRDWKNGSHYRNVNGFRSRTKCIYRYGEYGRGDFEFTEPSGHAYLSDGSYVICDTNNHRIVYYSADHDYIRVIGQPPHLPTVAQVQAMYITNPKANGFTRQKGYLYFPNRVAICPRTQHIVATERAPSHDVQIFTIDGDFVHCFGGNFLLHPRGLTVDEEGVIIVVECKVMRLTLFEHDGEIVSSHSLINELGFPNDVAARDKKIYISDNRGHCVRVFSYNGVSLSTIGNGSVTFFPVGVSINHLNQVVVTSNHNTFNITVFDTEGNVLHGYETLTKLAQCHSVALHPFKMHLILSTRDCNVYVFDYNPFSDPSEVGSVRDLLDVNATSA